MKKLSELCLFNVTIILGLFVFLISFGNFSVYLDNNTAYASTKLKYTDSTTSIKNFDYNNDSIKEFKDPYNNNTDLTITIKSEKYKYYNDDILTIFGNVYNNNLTLTNKTVLSITSIFNKTPLFNGTKEQVTLQKTTIPVIGGSYNFTQYLGKTGFYNISVSDKDDNNNGVSFVIEAKYKFFSYTFIILYFTGILLVLYGIITWYAGRIPIINKKDKKQTTASKFYNWFCDLLKRLALKLRIINKNNELEEKEKNELEEKEKNELEEKEKNELEEKEKKELEEKEKNELETTSKKFKYEIFRFFILSAISILPLISFVVMDVEIGKYSPIGLIMQNTQTTKDIQQDIRTVQWVINIGGSPLDNYGSGLIIPFYVFALGWLGGYLRYLHRVVTKISILYNNKPIYDKNDILKDMELNTALWLHLFPHSAYIRRHQINKLPLFMYASFEELAEILLAPLLAIAVWLLINTGYTPNMFTSALISFSVGLITKDVIYRIIEFSKNSIGERRQQQGQQSSDKREQKTINDETKPS